MPITRASVSPGSLSNGLLVVWRGGTQVAAVPSWLVGAVTGLVAVTAAATIFAATAVYFRDDVVRGLVARHADMQASYEDRLARLRVQLDQLAMRKMFDQDTLEGKLQDVAARQAKLESRAAMVAALAQSAGLHELGGVTAVAAQRPAPQTAAAQPPVRGRAGAAPAAPALPPTASSFAAPLPPAPAPARRALEAAAPRDGKPRPEAMEIAPAPQAAPFAPLRERGASMAPRLFDDARMPAAARVAAVSASVSEVETAQIRTVTAIGEAAQVQTARLTRALADAGLAAERFIGAAESKTRGVGGPFVPFKLDPKGSPFEREVLRLQEQVRIADRLRDAVRRAPLRRPLPEGAETTSSFGSRVDPFLGRLAYHTGLDFRGEHGSPIRATGDGVVTHAGSNGGYGLMVEIDHGDGLTTRYAHLSAVLVEEGQRLASGAVVGRLGSTGRSTGPHLHYEVRIDDEAVDPMRFLRAGARHAALP